MADTPHTRPGRQRRTGQGGHIGTTDTVVVGNGVLGLSVALRLALAGLRVSVVGPSDRRGAASAAAGAMHGCFGEVTTGLLATAEGRAKLALDIAATSAWDPWRAQLEELTGSADALTTSTGTVVILNAIGAPELDSANFAVIRATLDEHKEPYEQLEPEDIAWLAPSPLARPLRALHIPNETSIDAAGLLRVLRSGFLAAGGTLVDDLVIGLDETGGHITGAHLAGGGHLSADTVVVAAGAASSDLLAGVGTIGPAVVPMVSGYGVSLLVDTEDSTTPDVVIRTPNRAFACGLHAVPRSPGRLYVGATNIISAAPRTTAAISDLSFLLECATTQLHTGLSEAGVANLQVGNRPVPADGYPMVGPSPVSGLYVLSGTYRDGLHQSPLLSAHIAGLITGDPLSPIDDGSLAAFAPVRAPLCGLSRAETVEMTVAHMMATGIEHAWRVPAEWPPRIERHLRRFYSQRVETWHHTYTPPPELVAAMAPAIETKLLAWYSQWP